MLENVSFNNNPSWHIVIHYYHFGEGWRYGTHYHKSYKERWSNFGALDVQCRKVSLPRGDFNFSYGAFYLMQELRDVEEAIDVREKIDAHARAGDFVLYYEPSKPVFLHEVENKYPELAGTGKLRDLIEKMEDFIGADHSQSVISTSDEGFSFGHRVTIEATKFFGANHPSMSFVKTIVDDYDRSWTTSEIKQWMRQLKRVLSEALFSDIE